METCLRVEGGNLASYATATATLFFRLLCRTNADGIFRRCPTSQSDRRLTRNTDSGAMLHGEERHGAHHHNRERLRESRNRERRPARAVG